MANGFSKEETVAFDQMLEGFNDALVMSNAVNIYRTDQTMMERSGDTIWRPMPYIMQSYNGSDATSNFNDTVQLSVPATIATQKHATALLTAQEMRDQLQEGRLGKGASQKLASDINYSLSYRACYEGSLVVKQTTAAAGFTDVALCDSLMNESGVPQYDRYIALTSRNYNSMANNLATRTMMPKSVTAYDKAMIGDVSGFTALKLDTGLALTAAAGGGSLTIDTRDVGANYYVPAATSTAGTGETSNVDNRYQTVTISATTNVAAGDCFTIANVYNVHPITKISTGSLKTFRVISVDSGTTMTISPPIISNQVAADASAQYQNCTVTSKASNAAITFLNTATKGINPFWQKDALEILPGRLAVPSNAGAQILRASTDQGIEVVMQKFYDINTGKTKFRWDVYYGTVCLNPEQCGIILFDQT